MDAYVSSVGTCINITTILIQKIDANSSEIVAILNETRRGDMLEGMVKVVPFIRKITETALADALYSLIVEFNQSMEHEDEDAEKKALSHLVTEVRADLAQFVAICNDVCVAKKGTDSDISKLQKKIRELEKRFTLFV